MTTVAASPAATAAPSGAFAFFANLKVKTKVMIGFGIVLVLLAAVSAASLISFLSVARNFAAFGHGATVVEITDDVDILFLETQRHAAMFGITTDVEHLKHAQEKAKGVRAKVEEGLKVLKVPELHKAMREIGVEFETYMKALDKLAVIEAEQAKIIKDKLNPLGTSMQKGFEDLAAAAAKAGNSDASILARTALQELMEVRLDVNKVLRHFDEDAAKHADSTYDDLVKATKALDGQTKGQAYRAQFDTIAPLVPQYRESYKRAFEAEIQIEKLIEHDMENSFKVIQETVHFIKSGAEKDQDAIEHELNSTIHSAEILILSLALGALVLALALALALAWLIGGGIAKPIIAMTGAMQKLAQGDKTTVIPAVGRTDEVGQMAATVQVFKDNMIKAEELEKEQKAADERAAADKKAAEEQAAAEKKKAMHDLATSFERSIGSIIETVSSAATEMQTSAQALSATAEETTRQATAVAAASEEASTNVQTVASATEELAASVQEVGRQVTLSANIAQKAVDEASKTNERVSGLAEAAQKIGEVVNLINDIASQTNLLALNATIEAARAGEAGKGFAVVASEVKSLATQTAKATEDIGAQISAIQGATTDAVTAIKGIGNTIAEINDIATAIASAVKEQSSATNEIANNVSQAAAGTQQVASNIANVTQAAAETGNASSQMLSAASSLGKESEALRHKADEFLETVRAA